jgi:2'-5' RNA ligase
MPDSQPASWRLFAAVIPSATALIDLERQLESRKAVGDVAGLRWLAGESLHLTLQFFGAVPETRVEPLAEACARAAVSCKPFALSLSGAGAFPKPQAARVVWVGVGQGADQLQRLAAAVEHEAAPLGWSRDAHGFTPHLSVARSSAAFDASPLTAALRSIELCVHVTHLALVRSRLGAPAARYDVLHGFALG